MTKQMTEQPRPTIVDDEAHPRPRAGRLTPVLAVALIAALVAVAAGVLAVTQLRTGGEAAQTLPATPADPEAWMNLDPWIERQLRIESRRVQGDTVATNPAPAEWMHLDPWIERQLRIESLRVQSGTVATNPAPAEWMHLDPWIERQLRIESLRAERGTG